METLARLSRLFGSTAVEASAGSRGECGQVWTTGGCLEGVASSELGAVDVFPVWVDGVVVLLLG